MNPQLQSAMYNYNLSRGPTWGSAPLYGPVNPNSPYANAGSGVNASRPATGQVLGASAAPRQAAAPAQGPSPFDAASAAASSGNNALLSSLNTEFDRNSSALQGQLGYLDTQKGNALSSLDTEFQGVQKQVGTSKTNAQTNTDTQITEAGDVARSTQKANRNVLRALGILNSSAAGELLGQPMNEFDKQRAHLSEALGQRLTELDDFLNQRTAEHANAAKQISDQYSQLVGQIQSDLRFNDRQRADAIQQANSALQQRLSEIQSAQANYQNQVNTYKNNIATQVQQMTSYQNPTANVGAIQAQGIQTPGQTNQTAGVVQFDPRKALLSGGLSLGG